MKKRTFLLLFFISFLFCCYGENISQYPLFSLNANSTNQPSKNDSIIKVTKVEFANGTSRGDITTTWGDSLIAQEMRLLIPKIYFDGLSDKKNTIHLNYKILKSDGKMLYSYHGNKLLTSPSDKITVYPKQNQSYILSGAGQKTYSIFDVGSYRFQLWFADQLIYETDITFYISEEQRKTEEDFAKRAYMDIREIGFANTNASGDVITPCGSKLYASKIKYITPRIVYWSRCYEDKKVTLFSKIINPDGTLNKSASSPDGYTCSRTITIPYFNMYSQYLLRWGSNDVSIYQPGTYRYELWYEGNKIYETTFTLYKTDEEIQMEREYASRAYMDIKKIEFGNTDGKGKDIIPRGATLYASQMRFLSPKIYFDAKCAENKEVTLYCKIIKPDGTLSSGSSSPSGYSNKTTKTVYLGNEKSWTLTGWGSENSSIYQPGTYRYELWYEGNKIYETTFALYKTDEEIQMEREYASRAYMDIKKIEFCNKENKINELTPYGSRMYASQMRFLSPKIYFDAKCAENKEVKLFSKIINPDGTLHTGTSSPNGYTNSTTISIYPGNEKSRRLTGWGNENSSVYQPGTYRYELWYEDNKIYETTFALYKTDEEIQMEREYASRAYMDIKKIEFCNKENKINELTPYGSRMYASQMRFLSPKIYFDAKCAENKEVKLFSKIINPDGTLHTGTSSPNGYTNSTTISIYPGNEKSRRLTGWGNENSSVYQPGTYRYELWYEGNKIYETTFTLYKTEAEIQAGNDVVTKNSQTPRPASTQSQSSSAMHDLRNLTLADIFPNEHFPMTWTTTVGGMSFKSTLHASGLLELQGSIPCTICNFQSGICNVCGGLKGRYDIDLGFIPCAACGGTGKCNFCKGTGVYEAPKQVYRIDPLQIMFPGDGSAAVETTVQGGKTKISIPTQYKYETCTLCGGSGRMDGSTVGFGNTKYCEKCRKMMPDSHCHGCKQCPGCGGTGVRRKMVH